MSTNEVNRLPQNKDSGIQCTHCKVYRLEENFIGKTGKNVKQCLGCRERDDKHKKEPAIIAKRNAQQREVRRDIAYREREREKDETAYLEKNAIIHKEWYDKNKKHCSEYATNNFANRFRAIKEQAQTKKIFWNDDLTDEYSYTMMTSNCFYCHFKSEKTLNGIDRMDSNQGYCKANCVSCCKICNFMKGSLDPTTFIKKCQHISKTFDGIGQYHPELFPNRQSSSFDVYKSRAQTKGFDFTLTENDYKYIIQQKCNYCKKETDLYHTNGIDRTNNDQGYTIENCVACCSECNYMKGSLNDREFIESCKNIANHTFEIDVVIPETEQCLNKISKREKNNDVIKTKIIITKQQPNQPKETKPIIEYIPKQREYIRKNNLPSDCGVNLDEIPKYCYYIAESKTRGDGFCCDKNHPKQKNLMLNDYKTTQSKSVSTREKFQMLLDYLSI
jgi:hypothetical protein